MRIGVALQIIGGSISLPSKMPGTAFDLPATACRAGSKLVNVPGTACSGCYALKGTYTRANVAKAHRRRLAALQDRQWVEAMVLVLKKFHSGPILVDLGALGVRLQKAGGDRYFMNEPGWHRWHSSGDLQSVDHLRKICEVAERTPKIRHWLPTQELGMVKQYLAYGGVVPKNLVVRVSSIMVDDQHLRAWPQTSSVITSSRPFGHLCPAPEQDHKCGSCRACWSRSVAHVCYRKH